MKRIAAVTLAAGVLWAGAASVALAVTFPAPAGYVNDYAGMFSPEDRAVLESTLAQFEQETSNEIVVVTTPSLEGDVIENVAVRLFKEWGIGKAEQDNGVLLLVARDDREVRIEVGYGLEPVLTDLQSAWIIRELITPAFREERYAAGVTDAVNAIMAAARQEYSIPSADAQGSGMNTRGIAALIFDILPFALFTVFLIARALLGGTRSFWLGGVLGAGAGALIGFFILGSILVAAGGAVALGIIGLILDYLVSRKWKGTGMWTGGIGHGGFGGRGGGGFGGFGGGMSGGGGASGRW